MILKQSVWDIVREPEPEVLVLSFSDGTGLDDLIVDFSDGTGENDLTVSFGEE